MKMTPRIESTPRKLLLGNSIKMSLTNDKTQQLWRGFGPKIKEIQHRASPEKISLQIYPPGYFSEFNPQQEFEKWACVEVSALEDIPDGMKPLTLERGMYAVFEYKGPSSDKSIYQRIFLEWLPQSKYALDERPHFEVLGDKYSDTAPDSEEEIWIPIMEKARNS